MERKLLLRDLIKEKQAELTAAERTTDRRGRAAQEPKPHNGGEVPPETSHSRSIASISVDLRPAVSPLDLTGAQESL